MNKLTIAKKAVSIVVGMGVGKIAHDIIANNINEPENVIQKVTTITGAAVIGMMARDASKAYINSEIDDIVDAVNAIREKLQETKDKKEESTTEQ